MKFTKTLLSLILAIGLASPAIAQTIEVVTEQYPPYNYTEGGKIIGASTEVVEEVLKRAGITYTLTSYPWTRAYKMAMEKANVLIYSIGRNEKREKLFKWVDIIASYNIYLFKLKSRGDITLNSIEDAKKFKLGGVRDDVRTQYLEKQGFAAGKEIDLVKNDELNIKKLKAGKIDLFPIDENGMAYLAKQSGFSMDDFDKALYIEELSAGLYMAFSTNTDDSVVNKCKEELKKLKDDGTHAKIQSKYLK